MSVVLYVKDFCINGRFNMDYADVPFAVAAHLAHCPGTACVEAHSASYAAAGFLPAQTPVLVDAICRWGGKIGPYISTRVRSGNTPAAISGCLKASYSSLTPQAAISQIIKLRSLAISFGSKHLRMMRPWDRVVLDRILAGRLGYALDPSGYATICSDCLAIANMLTSQAHINPVHSAYARARLPNPRRNSTVWWPADIETALFAESVFPAWSRKGTWQTMPAERKESRRLGIQTPQTIEGL